MQRHLPHHLIPDEPSSRGAKSSLYEVDAKLLRQIVKRGWSVGKQSRTQPGTKSRLRVPDLLPERALLARRLAVKLQFCSAADEFDICPGFMQQSGEIQRGGSPADYDNIASPKPLYLTMSSAV